MLILNDGSDRYKIKKESGSFASRIYRHKKDI